MSEKIYISASDIGLYTFCPRAWVLKQLDYKPDNQWKLQEGKEFHEEIGRQEINKALENEPVLKRKKIQLRTLNVLMILVLLLLFSVLTRILLK
ncbi:MAG: hypothetical protein IKP86_14545 [Anaerolineaceae bacterium]|nr:hypothetical protein [Anaerolineaceae bacterium]